jgi:AcrR family transcriptional regulator
MTDTANPYRRALLRQERSRQTRDEIVRAALKVWRAKGFDQTTVDDIVAEAGVGSSTFYYHFAGKDSVLVEIGRLTAEVVDRETLSEARGALAADLDAFVVSIARRVSSVPTDIVASVVGRTFASIGQLGSDPVAGTTSFASTLEALLVRARDTKELGRCTDAGELSAVLTSMLMEGMLRWSLGTSPSDDLATVLRWRTRIFLGGIGSTEPSR